MTPLSYMPPAVMSTQYALFSRNSKRGFGASSKPLLDAVGKAKSDIRKAKSIDELPLFTEIAIEYGKLLTQGVLSSFIKGYDASRKRRIRKNSNKLEDLVKFDWNLQNTAAVAAFSREAFTMASVQTEELRSALFEEAKAVFASGGNYRDWADSFSLHGFEPENPFHLRTNYDTAANAAYSAGQWEQINENKDLFPFLRYVTMQDDKVREEHWMLHDLIYPVDDPFWDNYMPPNGWNCRCSVEQLMQSELPKDYSPMPPNAPVMVDPKFMNNPGKTTQLSIHPGLEPIFTDWISELLPKFSTYTHFTEQKMIDTSSLSLPALKDLYKSKISEFKGSYLAPNSMLCLINDRVGVINKFDAVTKATDLRARFKYLNYIPDIIEHPDEIWLINKNGKLRPHFLKAMEQNLVIVFEFENGYLDYFNIMVRDRIDQLRSGVLTYKKSLR